jgi:hypothetical protein
MSKNLILTTEQKKTQKEAIKNLKNFAKLYCVEICSEKKTTKK